MMRCSWSKKVHGFYVLPLVGVRRTNGIWSLWIGWLYWLFIWRINANRDTV